MASQKSTRTAHTLVRHLRAALPWALALGLLLGLSQLLWRWQTWKVRQLLDLVAGGLA